MFIHVDERGTKKCMPCTHKKPDAVQSTSKIIINVINYSYYSTATNHTW